MKKTFLKIIRIPKNIVFIFLMSILFFILFRFLIFYRELINFYSLDGISFSRYFSVSYEYIFSYFSITEIYEQINTIILSFLGSINFLFFIIYTKRQKKFLHGKSFFTAISGIFLGFFGVGCISCGAFILAPLITILGLSSYLKFFKDNASYFSFIGIIFIIVSIFYLLKQIAKPPVCK